MKPYIDAVAPPLTASAERAKLSPCLLTHTTNHFSILDSSGKQPTPALCRPCSILVSAVESALLSEVYGLGTDMIRGTCPDQILLGILRIYSMRGPR